MRRQPHITGLTEDTAETTGGWRDVSRRLAETAVRAPLVAPACGFAAGLAAADGRTLGLVLPAAVFAAAMAAIAVFRKRAGINEWFILLASCAAGAIWHDATIGRAAANDLAFHVGDARRLVRVEGVVATPPITSTPDSTPYKPWVRDRARTRFYMAVDRLVDGDGEHGVRGLVQVHVNEPALGLSLGDRVKAFGWIRLNPPPTNPGQFDWARRQARRGQFADMSVEHAAAVQRVDTPQRWSALRFVDRIRRSARAAFIGDALPEDPQTMSLVEGLLLGQRSRIDRGVNEAFIRAGASHYLSVSGAHVGVLAASLWGVLSLFGVGRRRSAVVVLAVVVLYGIIVEPRAPAVRAVIMAIMFCIAVWLRRPVSTGNWLAAATLLILIVRPNALFEPGFQLSCATLIGIMALHRPIRRAIVRLVLRRDPLLDQIADPTEPAHWAVDWVRLVGEALLWVIVVSVAAWIVSAPLSAYHFHRISLWGWLTTPLLFPLVTLTMWGGLVRGAIGICWPSAAWLADPLLEWPAAALRWLAEGLAALPLISWPTPPPPLWWLAVFYVVLALALLARTWRPARWAAAAGAALLIVAFAWPRVFPPSPEGLRVRVLAVGDGTAITMALPNGESLLYDAGTLGAYDAGENVVIPALYHDGVRRIDTAIISHPNVDHYSAITTIADAVPIERVAVNDHFRRLADNAAAQAFVEDVERMGIAIDAVRTGDDLARARDVTLVTLWPPPFDPQQQFDANDTSTVLRVEHAGVRILLCGDIEEAAVRGLLESGVDLSADVLVLPHHGAVVDGTDAFLRAVDATYLIRSSGTDLSRTSDALIELISGQQYYNTADDGAITIEVSPAGGLTVTPFIRRN